jgi:hypothetical protein
MRRDLMNSWNSIAENAREFSPTVADIYSTDCRRHVGNAVKTGLLRRQ